MSSARQPHASRKRSARRLALAAAIFALAAPGSAQIIPGDGASRAREYQPTRALIFFPPLPPPLDPAVTIRVPAALHPSAPAELAEYVGEIFYPQLGTRLHAQRISDKQRQQLASYRATKQALQREIQRELAQTRTFEPARRREALEALARRQGPAVAALEQSAEQLRVSLIDPELAWNTHRQWHLASPDRRAFSPLEIAQVIRACAFYEKHLTLAQRGLLREIVHELALADMTVAAASAAQTHVFFSPSPARIRWREDAPPAATALFARYQSRKASLKKELYDAVVRNDGGAKLFRGAWLAELAAKQAAELAAIEALAEEIRRGLPPPPSLEALLPRTALSPRLAEEIAALQRRREAIRKEATLQLEAISSRLREQEVFLRINFRFEIDGLKFIVIPTRPPITAETKEQVQSVGVEISAIADAYGRDLAGCANREDVLRTEIGAAIGSNRPAAIDDAFHDAIRAVEASRNAAAFVDYQAAVYEPGLSPAQRRVLFDAAVEKFELPLLRGELQPWRRNDTW